MDFLEALVWFETELWNRTDRGLGSGSEGSLANVCALRALHLHDGRGRVHELSATLRITVGAASKLVDRLEAAGLVERLPNPSDRRSSLIALTREGKATLSLATSRVDALIGELLPNAAERAAAMQALTPLQRALDENVGVGR